MLKSIHIENFRGFEELEVSGFARFNLIAGKNGTGKTALLEALLASRSTAPTNLAVLDGQRGWQRDFVRVETRGAWRYLFRDATRPFVLESQGTRLLVKVVGQLRPAHTHLLAAQPLTGVPGAERVTEADLSTRPAEELQWQMYVNTELHAEAIGQGTPIGLFVRVTVPPPASDGDGRVGVVLTTTALSTELFDTFTRLKRDGKIGGLIAGVQVLHPWIEDLELFSEGGQTLAASGGGRKLFPLPLLGEGLMRVAQILLTIAKTEKGVILIDEIERGFHYEALPEVWKAIRAAADAVDVQVFATTHSYECIAAANEVFADSPSDLALIRLQNLHGKVRAIDYPPDVRQSAIEHGSEVR